MSHLARGYSIIIGEETKNVNENGVQVVEVDKVVPCNFLSHFLEILQKGVTTF